MKYQIRGKEAPVDYPLEVWLQEYDGGVSLRCKDKNGCEWHIAQLTHEGALRLYRSVSRVTGLDVDSGGRINVVDK